jgi:hypothetical protein
MPDDYLTFSHKFSRGLQCTLKVRDEPPAGFQPNVEIKWIGRPNTSDLPSYRKWILATFQLLADRWQQKILYCLGASPTRTELWTFEPNKRPKLMRKLPFGL